MGRCEEGLGRRRDCRSSLEEWAVGYLWGLHKYTKSSAEFSYVSKFRLGVLKVQKESVVYDMVSILTLHNFYMYMQPYTQT